MRVLLRAGAAPFEVPGDTTTATFGFGNSGNFIFANAVYGSLSRPDNTIAVNRYRPDYATAEEINEKYDVFVLPLANAFRRQYEGELLTYAALIERLKIPCVVVGIGAQAGLDLEELKPSAIDGSVRRFVSAVLERSATIGVRGEITHDYLRRLGFHAIDIIGCPSMFLRGAALQIEKLDRQLEATDRIAVNYTEGTPVAVAALMESTLASFLNSVFVAQGQPEMRAWNDKVQKISSGTDRVETDRVRYFDDMTAWLDFMKTRVFAFGTRIHGNIAALLAGVPAMVIAHDSRTLELAQYHQIPFCLANEISAETAPSRLYDRTNYDATNKGALSRFEQYKSFLKRNGLATIYDAGDTPKLDIRQ
jgi:hypothetical protein